MSNSDTSAMIDADLPGIRTWYPSMHVPIDLIRDVAMVWVGGVVEIQRDEDGNEIEIEFTVSDAEDYIVDLTAAIVRERELRVEEIRSWDDEDLAWELEKATDQEATGILFGLSPSLAMGVTPEAILPLLSHRCPAVREAAIRLNSRPAD